LWAQQSTKSTNHFVGRSRHRAVRRKGTAMLYWTLVFLVVAVIAGALGFGGIAGASAGLAQILFFVFLAFLAISLIAGLLRRAS